MKLYLAIFLLSLNSCSEDQVSKKENIPSTTAQSNSLEQDIPIASEWLVTYFNKSNISLDYSLQSIKKIDAFFDENTVSGKPKVNSKLSDSLGYKLFSISSYVGQVIIKNSPGSKWITDDTDPNGEVNIEIITKDSAQMWPAQKVIKRFKNGNEDELYSYAYFITQRK